MSARSKPIALILDIRLGEHVYLHLYTPSTIKHVRPCEDPKLHSVPPVSSDWSPPWAQIDQLNEFTGRLYLRNYTSDAFSRRTYNGSAGVWGCISSSQLVQGPRFTLPFVVMLLTIGRKGMGFAETHMGRILTIILNTGRFDDDVPVYDRSLDFLYDSSTLYFNGLSVSW